jgi:thiamine kinase-like enzyme
MEIYQEKTWFDARLILVHSDLNFSNILIDEQNCIKLR